MARQEFRRPPSPRIAPPPRFDDPALASWADSLYRALTASDEQRTVGARVWRSTAQTISDSTTTPISFDTERYDNGGMWVSGSPTLLRAVLSGIYLVTASIEWAVNSTGYRHMAVYNTTTSQYVITQDMRTADASNVAGMSCAGLVKLDLDDTIRLEVWQNRGGTLNINATADYTPIFAAHWLGPAQE